MNRRKKVFRTLPEHLLFRNVLPFALSRYLNTPSIRSRHHQGAHLCKDGVLSGFLLPGIIAQSGKRFFDRRKIAIKFTTTIKPMNKSAISHTSWTLEIQPNSTIPSTQMR